MRGTSGYRLVLPPGLEVRDGTRFYNQLPYKDDEEEYDYQGRSALTRPNLAPEPDAGRSIFDDIDED